MYKLEGKKTKSPYYSVYFNYGHPDCWNDQILYDIKRNKLILTVHELTKLGGSKEVQTVNYEVFRLGDSKMYCIVPSDSPSRPYAAAVVRYGKNMLDCPSDVLDTSDIMEETYYLCYKLLKQLKRTQCGLEIANSMKNVMNLMPSFEV